MGMTTEAFLEHVGVKGMKWGVRRDNSAGKTTTKPKADVRSRTSFEKAPKRLSDAELNRRIKRLDLEKKYNELNAPKSFEGKKYVQNILESSGKTVIAGILGAATSFFVQKALKEKFGG